MLIELIYTSVPAQAGMSLESILDVAHRKNPENGITGLLCFDGMQFVQILEGEEDNVMALFASIERDSRNTDVEVLHRGGISERSFENWTMASEHVPQGLLDTLSENMGAASLSAEPLKIAGRGESFGARLFGLFTQSVGLHRPD